MMKPFPPRQVGKFPGTIAFVILTLLAVNGRAEEKKVEDTHVWYDVDSWGVEGQGWVPGDLKSRYDRLPAKAEKIVRPPVWELSRDSAGLAFRFNTDATELKIRYSVGDKNLAMPHMPATGVSGVDLYALDGETWKWVDVTRPTTPDTLYTISEIDPGKRTYMAYLPLYNSTVKIEIGVPKGTQFEPIAPRQEKPIVFYGTSITHGACASRPGLCHPAILGRRLDRPVINLGFSGNGKMEPEVVALLAEIDAAVYVIDCLPNMNSQEVTERAEKIIRQIREVRPDTPIVLVEDRSFTNSWIRKSKRDHHADSRAALIRAFDLLVSSGVKNLHYIEGEALLGDDTEGATDGSHPNDLGFMRQADAFEPELRKALGMK
ncbi:MAG: SGNH/GDSL hydrolase family protein [Verrucomicrobiales bacterium]|nr:SGNH/GDSL hydrolase family protein [Verrucomicrobiales bacterium]